MSDIKVGDKITIEGLNIDSKGGIHFNKPSKKRRRLPMAVLIVTDKTQEVKQGDV
jgi:hypothetical protein